MDSVSDADFEAKVLRADRPVVVDFWAAWCAPCRMIQPAVEELAAELGERARFYRMDIDANRSVPAELQVHVYPTLIIFSQGRPAATQVGYRRDLKAVLAGELEQLLA